LFFPFLFFGSRSAAMSADTGAGITVEHSAIVRESAR